MTTSELIISPKTYKLVVRAVIFDEQRRCLLIRRSSKNRGFAGKWEWPGGKADQGEDFATALLREVTEEVGLNIELNGFAGATLLESSLKNLVLLICMEARIISGNVTLSAEHDAFTWVALPELPQQDLSENVRSFMLEYAARHKTGSSPVKQAAQGCVTTRC